MPPSTVAPLVHDVAACFDSLPGIVGPPAAAREFASIWCPRHDVTARDTMQQRIYQLRKVIQPRRAVAGELRVATSRDLDLVTSWVECFEQETGTTSGDVRARVSTRIHAREMVLWHDEGPRCLAGCAGRSPRGVRIGYVYTPPEWRGRGYASACVAAFSQHLLYSGAQFCCLYTDLANPASNLIYQRLGYEPVSDSVQIAFE